MQKKCMKHLMIKNTSLSRRGRAERKREKRKNEHKREKKRGDFVEGMGGTSTYGSKGRIYLPRESKVIE